MKQYKCPNCFRERIKEDNITFVHCPCGYEMKEVKEQ